MFFFLSFIGFEMAGISLSGNFAPPKWERSCHSELVILL